MKKRHYFRYAAISILLGGAIFLTTGFVDKYQMVVRKLATIEAVLDEYYVGDLDTYKLQEGIYKGFISGVGDAYTTYYTEKEYNAFKEQSSGVDHGSSIPMSFEKENNRIHLVHVL